jgi:hypothetical protein
VFRRRNAEPGSTVTDQDGAEPDAPESANSSAFTPGKGRPTPKRSEAERRRHGPYSGSPADRKAATAQSKTRDRTDRARKYEAMKRGEEWALAPRDKGPIRGLTRDYVDSKRRLSEYYMYILIVLMVALFGVRTTSAKDVVYYVVVVLAVVIVIEGTLTTRAVRKMAAARFPGVPARGITLYAIMRSMQIRRLRMPSPRVKAGDKI